MTTTGRPDGHDRKLCGGKKRDGSGDTCRRPAGWGTGHAGTGRCKLHGGNTTAHVTHAQREQAREAVATYGLPVDVDPHDALLQEVHRTAGHVAWLAAIVADLERDAVVRGITKTVALPDTVGADGKVIKIGGRRVEVEAAVNTWVKLYQDERDHLRRVCADAIRAGVEERRVEIEEAKAAKLAEVVRAIVVDLGHDPADDRVRQVVRLRLIEGGKPE